MNTRADNGYNPIRWDCKSQGCFAQNCRPRIEELAEALPGRMAFGDLDGMVEIGGNVLILEFKHPGSLIPKGQLTAYQKMTDANHITVFVIWGESATMRLEQLSIFYGGKQTAPVPVNLNALRNRISAWANYAQRNRVA